MTLDDISAAILDETRSDLAVREALNEFSRRCSALTGIAPSPSFDGWAQDTYLHDGVAINPQAAAYCVSDYRRTTVFIRAVYEAIELALGRFDDGPIRILYAGCGPFATLLLPLLGRFPSADLDIVLLDVHQDALDSVALLVGKYGFDSHRIQYLRADACTYQHPDSLHVVIAETMQKALEQEPQFAVTANLAPQLCARGIFVPEEIVVELGFGQLQAERELFNYQGAIDVQWLVESGRRLPLGRLMRLAPPLSALNLVVLDIPRGADLENFDLLLFTRIKVFGRHSLADYESEITLPLKCNDLARLAGGETIEVAYQLGTYPKFCLRRREAKDA